MKCNCCNTQGSFSQFEIAHNSDKIISEILICKNCYVLCNPKLFFAKQNILEISAYQSGNVSTVYAHDSYNTIKNKIKESSKIFDYVINNNIIKSRKEYLDYGCGAGYLAIAASSLFDNVAVIDLDTSVVEKNIEITNSKNISIVNYIIQEKKYDLITLWHTLEHIADPRSLLIHLKKTLNRNGVIFIQTPLYRREYFIDSHMWFFNHAVVSFMANDLGFSDHLVSYDVDNSYITFCFIM